MGLGRALAAIGALILRGDLPWGDCVTLHNQSLCIIRVMRCSA